MPELPELEVLRDNLEKLIKGKTLTGLRIIKPYIQKTAVPGDLVGQKLTAVRRRGKYIVIDLGKHRFIVHLMLAGRFKKLHEGKAPQKIAAAVMEFGNVGVQLVEDAKLKRMSMWIVDAGTRVEDIKRLGPEPLTREFTADVLMELMSKTRERLKSFLVNQANIAGIGNAYSDEICWHARLSPFKPANKLTEEEVDRVYAAIREILPRAIEDARRLTGDGLVIDEKRPSLAVHRRKGEACPRCGSTVQWVSTSSRNTYYCPECQTGGKILKDGRTSKFLR